MALGPPSCDRSLLMQDFIRAAETVGREVSRDNLFEQNVIDDLLSRIIPTQSEEERERVAGCAQTVAELLDYYYRRYHGSPDWQDGKGASYNQRVNRLWKLVVKFNWTLWAHGDPPTDEAIRATLLYKVRIY